MRHHTWEPTVLSRGSCRPLHLNIDRFHQPCLLPWRTPTAAVKTAAVRAGIGGGCHLPYHVATTCPCGHPGLPSVRLTGGTYHADWTVPRQDVKSPFCMCHPHQRCFHTRRFGTLAVPRTPVTGMPWGPDPLGHQYDEEFHVHCEEWISNCENLVAHGSPSILASWFVLEILVSLREKKIPNTMNFRRYFWVVLLEQEVVHKRFRRYP